MTEFDIRQAGEKVTFLAIALALIYGGFQAFQASGWEINQQFYAGIILMLFGIALLVFREYWKTKYNVEPVIDTAEVDKVIEDLHKYRDFVKSHADVQLAMADMAIEIAKAANLPQPTINKIELLRSKWYTFLQTL